MALSHAKPGEPIDIAPLGTSLRQAATHAILKTRALELIRLVLRAGQELPPHSVYGELTLLCLEGAVSVTTADGAPAIELRTNQLVLLSAQIPHGVRALEDASLLLTVQLPPGLPGSASST
jgi:quercetin dioxygenase-like cupin family protein